MTRTLKSRLGALAICFFCAAVIFSGVFPLEAGAKTVIRLAHHHPIKAYPHQWALDFKDIVEKNSKGEIEVQIFPASQLGQERENIHGVNMHTVDMTFATPAFLDEVYPGAAITTLPFLFDDYAHVGMEKAGLSGRCLRFLRSRRRVREHFCKAALRGFVCRNASRQRRAGVHQLFSAT